MTWRGAFLRRSSVAGHRPVSTDSLPDRRLATDPKRVTPSHHGTADLATEFALDFDPARFAVRYVEADLAATHVPEPIRATPG